MFSIWTCPKICRLVKGEMLLEKRTVAPMPLKSGKTETWGLENWLC